MQAEFIQGSQGKLFALVITPPGQCKGNIIFCPGFGEELNRCRHIVANQARHFAALGYNCFLVDYYGTGDSEGELVQADWGIWCHDLELTIEWVKRSYGNEHTILWGLRLGCLLAANVVSRAVSTSNSLLFWQPVTDGKKYVTQLLRQRMAHIVEHGLPKQSTDEMREYLSTGGSIEVGGYQLGGPLAMELDKTRMGDALGFSGCTIHWLQQAASDAAALPLASRNTVETLISLGNKVLVSTFEGAPVWQLHERVSIEDIYVKTNCLEWA